MKTAIKSVAFLAAFTLKLVFLAVLISGANGCATTTHPADFDLSVEIPERLIQPQESRLDLSQLPPRMPRVARYVGGASLCDMVDEDVCRGAFPIAGRPAQVGDTLAHDLGHSLQQKAPRR